MGSRRGTRAGKAAGRSRTPSGGASGRKRSAGRRRSAAQHTGGRRDARRAEAARQVRAEDAGATELRVVMEPEPAEAGVQQAAEASGGGGTSREAGEREAAAHRRDEERRAREALRVQAAAAELERRREESDASLRAAEERTELPGMAGMALELLVGSMRLVRAIAMAPLRLGLAFLDRSA